jgi:hypothetical protein
MDTLTSLSRYFEYGLTIVKALNKLIPVVFSPKAIVFTRKETSALTSIENLDEKLQSFSFFQQYMQSHPTLQDLLFECSVDVDKIPHLTLTDAYFVSDLETATTFSPDQVHLGDFIDLYWARNPETSLPFWRLLAQLPKLDEDMLNFESRKVSVVENVHADFRNRLSHYDVQMGLGISSWLRTVGSLLKHLWEASPSGVQACLPSSTLATEQLYDANQTNRDSFDLSDFSLLRQFFYFIRDNVEVISPFYLCIADGVDSESIVLAPSEDRCQHLTTLMHLVKLGTSPSAFIIANF